MDKTYYIYILASQKNGTLYIGVTKNLTRRVWEHKEGQADGFTKQYAVHMLVYYESYADIRKAIAREKAMKKWKREWKIRRIKEFNPEWKDLYETLV